MEDKKSSQSNIRFVVELLEVIVPALILFWVLHNYVIEICKIPTPSMVPTIQVGDQVIVDKFYFKYFDHLRPGDIIVFRPPPEAHSSENFIKRVVGLPGDKVEIKNHITYVNDKPLDERFITDQSKNNFGPIVIPQNDVFVMGDNRNSSYDSRAWGFLPMKNITGRTLIRCWPLNRFGALAR